MFWTPFLFHKLISTHSHELYFLYQMILNLGDLVMEIHLMTQLSLIWKFNCKGKNCLLGNAFSTQKQETN